MRIVFLIGMLLPLAGCAAYRDVAFIYYPNGPHHDGFPRPAEFYAEADRECGKYGLKATPYWSTYTDFQRVKVIYNCVQ